MAKPTHSLNPETWVDTYGDMLLNYVLTRIKSRDIAMDLVQETFFVALRSKDSFRGEISEKNWLFLILRSRILDYFKKKKEVLASQLPSNDDDDPESEYYLETGHWKKERAPQEWAPDKMVESKEFMSILDMCRDKLNAMQRTVFTLKYLDGEESETICKELNITSSNYWVLIHRAKLQLRKCLEMNWITK